MKKLYRSDTNKIFAGIMGGFGEYYEMDPVLLRAIAIAIILISGFFPGLIAYILMIFVIPQKPKEIKNPDKD